MTTDPFEPTDDDYRMAELLDLPVKTIVMARQPLPRTDQIELGEDGTMTTTEQLGLSMARLRDWLRSHEADRSLVEPRMDVATVLEFIEAIPANRLNPWHTVTVHATGWHMAHPITCDLANCPFDGLAQAEWTEAPHAEGVWRWLDFEDQPWEWQPDPIMDIARGASDE